jgi:hypothetical protein
MEEVERRFLRCNKESEVTVCEGSLQLKAKVGNSVDYCSAELFPKEYTEQY